jgi:rubrerythrin
MNIGIDFAKVSAVGVLDIAMAAEEEAEEHYDRLAQTMRRAGNAEAGEFFAKMAGREHRHREQIAARRRTLFGDAPQDLRHVYPWNVEVPDDRKVGGSTPLLDALRVSMEAEQRAHDYYEGALDYVSDPQTVTLFEQLRDAELEHKRLLQLEIDRLLTPGA